MLLADLLIGRLNRVLIRLPTCRTTSTAYELPLDRCDPWNLEPLYSNVFGKPNCFDWAGGGTISARTGIFNWSRCVCSSDTLHAHNSRSKNEPRTKQTQFGAANKKIAPQRMRLQSVYFYLDLICACIGRQTRQNECHTFFLTKYKWKTKTKKREKNGNKPKTQSTPTVEKSWRNEQKTHTSFTLQPRASE